MPFISTCSGRVDVLEETTEPFLRTASILLVDVLLHFELFKHRFDNPVGVFEQIEIVFQIAGGHELGFVLMRKARRFVCELFLDRFFRQRIAVGCHLLGTISSSTTGMPALAICAAMPLPITPEPRTATFEIAIITPPVMSVLFYP